MILAGDVGGTKVHLALYNFANGRLQPVRDEKFPAHEFASLEAVVEQFLSDGAERKDQASSPPASAVPGPVRDGRLKLTNLPWTLDCRDSQKHSRHPAHLPHQRPRSQRLRHPRARPRQDLHPPRRRPHAIGHRGLIAAGTGLGEALLIWDGKKHRPIPSEGGHCDFAARTNREIALLEYLRSTLNGRVSWERVVSGLGIKNIYAFLRDVEKIDEPAWLHDRMAAEDPNAVIGQCAEDGSSSLCFETMKIFAAAYGAEAGNIALKVLATGGIYLGGGIAPKILKTLQNGTFMQAFLDKGRLSPLLQSIPVRVILDDTCALLGAAAYAEARASESSGHSERAASLKT